MDSYLCESLQSGTTDWYIWVSIGFTSNKYGNNDVLHIVCGFHDDEEEPVEGIWLERTDQSEGGSGLAESIELFADRIRIVLTEEGLTTLAFAEKTLEFRFAQDQAGAADMRTSLVAMTNEPNGLQVHVV